jgi:uncharacterized membrane protein
MKRNQTEFLRLLLPPRLRDIPADLAFILVFIVSVNVSVFTPIIQESPLRVLLGLPYVLFIPGYAFISALFPEASDKNSEISDESDAESGGKTIVTSRSEGIDGIERVALSFGLSIAIVPLIGLILNFTPFGIRLVPIMTGITVFTLFATTIAIFRRQNLTKDDRFRVPYRMWLQSIHTELFKPGSRTDAALNVLLVISIILALTSVGYAVTVPKQGESFSEFYLLNKEDGELVADGYPTNITTADRPELIFGVSNQEYSSVDYTVIIQLQRVQIENNSTQVVQSAELNRFTNTLAHNETWHQTHNISASLTGQRLRLQYLLYRGDVPTSLSAETAYRETHLWMNVSNLPSTSG